MELNDTWLIGLQQFKIQAVDIRPLQMSARFTFLFDKLDMSGYHNTFGTIQNQIFPINIVGSGPYTLRLNNVFVSVYLDFNFIDGNYLNLEDLRVDYLLGIPNANFSGFGPINNIIFNNAIQVAIPIFALVKIPEVNDRIKDELVPILNDTLNRMTVIDFLGYVLNFFKDLAINFVKGLIKDRICNWSDNMHDVNFYDEAVKVFHQIQQ
jgi:Haemolymph juvenile hormone binding protein (JHBP)